ncbi:MAG: iron-sulfur cluster-binding domain-containing protein [Bacteroidetes bacterium]|nr:iron-sulfur cluster-binding domain-containing protein [Bacteroidota bacterium]
MDTHIKLRVISLTKETNDSITLELIENEGKEIKFKPGQFLTFIYNIMGEEIRRGYSISSSPLSLPKLRVTIKKIEDGFVSDHIFDTIKEEEIINAVPPLGNFIVKPPTGEKRNLVFFGAGSGITPLTSMIEYTLSIDPNAYIFLYYGNRNEESIIYKNLFDKLSGQYPNNFKLQHVLSRPKYNWKGITGRITKELTCEILNNSFKDCIDISDFYLCGPNEMMKNVIEALNEFGVPKDKINREIYTTSVVDQDEDIEELPRNVTIIFKDEEHNLVVEPGAGILQTALNAGLDLPNSCQYGSCGTCRAKLLSGQLKLIDQTALSDEEIEKGYCLTCVGYPVTDNVVILYED